MDRVVDIVSYHGWRFCPQCNNLLRPFAGTDETNVLEFKCRNRGCGKDVIIYFNR